MRALICLAILTLAACHHPNRPEQMNKYNWVLDIENSQFSFITTKNKVIAEEHQIQYKFGHITMDNTVVIELDLTTLDTGIPIRDERMKSILFKTDENPVATILASLPPRMYINRPQQLTFGLSLNGLERRRETQLMIQMIGQDMMITSFEPVAINAKDFDLAAGVNQLTKIAGLQGINYDITAEYTLRFKKNTAE